VFWLQSFVVPLFLRSFVPSFLPSFRRSFVRSFGPSFLCSFLPSFLPSFAWGSSVPSFVVLWRVTSFGGHSVRNATTTARGAETTFLSTGFVGCDGRSIGRPVQQIGQPIVHSIWVLDRWPVRRLLWLVDVQVGRSQRPKLKPRVDVPSSVQSFVQSFDWSLGETAMTGFDDDDTGDCVGRKQGKVQHRGVAKSVCTSKEALVFFVSLRGHSTCSSGTCERTGTNRCKTGVSQTPGRL